MKVSSLPQVLAWQGQRLRQARLAAGLSQTELAAMVEIGQSHLSGMERGVRQPSIETLEALGRVLGVGPHWLMGGEAQTALDDLEFGREHILADRNAPAGLVALAGDVVFCDRLQVTSAEWRCLRAVRSPQGLNREGYLAVLLAFRGHPGT